MVGTMVELFLFVVLFSCMADTTFELFYSYFCCMTATIVQLSSADTLVEWPMDDTILEVLLNGYNFMADLSEFGP